LNGRFSSIPGDSLRYFALEIQVLNADSSIAYKKYAYYRPFAGEEMIVDHELVTTAVAGQGRWIAPDEYAAGEMPTAANSCMTYYSIAGLVRPPFVPTATTTTFHPSAPETCRTVLEADKREADQGVLVAYETVSSGGRVLHSAKVRRNLTTGFALEEAVVSKSGDPSMDFHQYEFVLTGWPSGGQTEAHFYRE
jgi:hypothetical protein